MVNFTIWIPDCSHSPVLLNLFLSSNASVRSTVAFPPVRNSDHVVLVSIDFSSYSQHDTLFHHIAYEYSRTDWDGCCDHLRDVPWGISLNLVLLLLLVNFLSEFRLKLMYVSLIKSIRSSLNHLPALQINIIPLPVTMNRKIKKPPVKLHFQQSHQNSK